MSKETAGFDLSTLEQTDTTTTEINHPSTGEPLPGVIATIYGQDSETYRAESRKAETRYVEYSRRNRGKLMPAEDRERMDKEKYAKCTKSIDGLSYKGEPLTDVVDIFTRFPFVYEQIVQAILDRAGFIKGSSAK